MNPGPPKTARADAQIENMLATVPRIEKGQNKLLANIKDMKKKQTLTHKDVQELSDRLVEIEKRLAQFEALRQETGEVERNLSALSDRLNKFSARQNESENRSRKNNLVFYGIHDRGYETWADAELRVTQLCKDNLEMTVTSKK